MKARLARIPSHKIAGAIGFGISAVLLLLFAWDGAGDIPGVRNPVGLPGFEVIVTGGMATAAYLLFWALTGEMWVPSALRSPYSTHIADTSLDSVAGDGGINDEGAVSPEAATQAVVRWLEGQDAHPRDLYPVIVTRSFIDLLEAGHKAMEGTPDAPGAKLVRDLLARSQKATTVDGNAQMRRELRSCVPDEVLRAARDEWDSNTGGASFSESLWMVGRPGEGRGSWRWVFIFRFQDDSKKWIQRRIEVSTSGRRSSA